MRRLRRIAIVLLAFLVLSVAATRPTTRPTTSRTTRPTIRVSTKPATVPIPQWKLVWSDEFDHAGTIDPARWQFERGMVRNREAQLYTDRAENVRIEDGNLVIEARQERVPIPNKPGKFADYTAGSVETFSKAAWVHGRVEVRAKLPKGWGMWPAIWLMGTNITDVGWPRCGEIDVMENVGYEPDKVHASIHVKGEPTDDGKDGKEVSETSTVIVERLSKDFHLYAMEWDAKQVRVFVDDRRYFTYDRVDSKGEEKPWPFDKPMYLKLNLAVGGTWGGRHGIDEGIFPQKFLVDYVRVYEWTDR